MKISFNLIKTRNLPGSTEFEFWMILEKFKLYCLNESFNRHCRYEFDESITIEVIQKDVLDKGIEFSNQLKGEGLLLFNEFLENIKNELEFMFPLNLIETAYYDMIDEDIDGNELSPQESDQQTHMGINNDYYETLHHLFDFYESLRGLY